MMARGVKSGIYFVPVDHGFDSTRDRLTMCKHVTAAGTGLGTAKLVTTLLEKLQWYKSLSDKTAHQATMSSVTAPEKRPTRDDIDDEDVEELVSEL